MSRKTLLGGLTAAALIAFGLASPDLALAKHAHKASSHSTSHKSSKHGASKSSGKSSGKSSRHASKSRHGRHGSTSHASYGGPTNGASGKVVDVSAKESRSIGLATYTVKKSQGLAAVSRETHVSVEELAKLNNLKAPYHLKLGQKLKTGKSSSPSSGGEGGGKAYVVARGDTLTAVAKRFNVSAKELASLNKLGKSTALKPGRKLKLPDDFTDSGVVEARSIPRAPDLRQIPIVPGENATLNPLSPPSDTVAPPIDLAQVTAAGAGKFIWPLEGKVVQPFGAAAAASTAKTDDGINIAAPVGTPVKAAAPGVVIFAGKQIAAFGNYVLLQHDGGFLTAYGNMDKLNVKIGQHVSQGDEIGVSGQTGQADQPELHFEVLYAARKEDKSAPVDPQSLLPKL